MTEKRKLLELFHKLLTTDFGAFSGRTEEREAIIAIRNIIENCVVIPKDAIDKHSLMKQEESFEFGDMIVKCEKRFAVVSDVRFSKSDIKFIENIDINDKLLKNLCDYLESEKFANERKE